MTKPGTTPHSLNKKAFIALWIIVLLLVFTQCLSLYKIYQLNGKNSSSDTSQLVNTAEQRRYRTPPIDVAATRVYIPEIHAYVPLTNDSRLLRYEYRNTQNATTLYLSTDAIVGRQSDSSDDATCDKAVMITQSKQAQGDYSYVSSITPTKDGLQYVYRHSSCQLYNGTDIDALVALAKQLHSY